MTDGTDPREYEDPYLIDPEDCDHPGWDRAANLEQNGAVWCKRCAKELGYVIIYDDIEWGKVDDA